MLISPKIEAHSGSMDDEPMFVFDFEAWLPRLYDKKIMSPKEKIGYLYTLDQNISLGDALILMERF